MDNFFYSCYSCILYITVVSCVVFINGCVSIINYNIKREKSHYFGLNTICSFSYETIIKPICLQNYTKIIVYHTIKLSNLRPMKNLDCYLHPCTEENRQNLYSDISYISMFVFCL